MIDQAKDKSVDVAVFVGSLREGSFSRKVARALVELARPPLKLTLVDIGNLPLFNQDDEDRPPRPWVELRERVRAADAMLFVTPEYNRSVPAVLKNALDVGSRPEGKNVWNGKPGGVVSVTPYALGGFGANHHLRQVLVYLNVPTMAQPEVYVSHADKLFDERGALKNDGTRELLTKFLDAFASWVGKTR
jgi:chromate reductase, NAD(P)H dehydrogenase (quinone)